MDMVTILWCELEWREIKGKEREEDADEGAWIKDHRLIQALVLYGLWWGKGKRKEER
jgi:hypothetical protein